MTNTTTTTTTTTATASPNNKERNSEGAKKRFHSPFECVWRSQLLRGRLWWCPATEWWLLQESVTITFTSPKVTFGQVYAVAWQPAGTTALPRGPLSIFHTPSSVASPLHRRAPSKRSCQEASALIHRIVSGGKQDVRREGETCIPTNLNDSEVLNERPEGEKLLDN